MEGVGDGINGYLLELDSVNLYLNDEKDFLGSKHAAASIMTLYNEVNKVNK